MTASEAAWRRLHPASLAVNLVPQAWRTLRASWPLLLALVIGGDGLSGDPLGLQLFDLFVVVFFLVLTLSRTAVHWATLRYRVYDGRLEIRSGLLNRRARALDPSRIQNVSLEQNLFHRLSGLVELRVETAGDASTEGLLSALSVAEARVLQRELQEMVGRAEPTPSGDQGDLLVEMSAAETLAYGLSRRSIGAVAVLTAVGMELMARLGPQHQRELAWALNPRVIGGAVLGAFAVSWAFSALRAAWRHHGFRLQQLGDRLVTEEGLTTRRRVEIPLGKVQLVRADEPFLRRRMGYGTLLIETAALGFADGAARQAEGVVPMVGRDELPGIARRAAPAIAVDPWTAELLPAHPRALYRLLVARFIRGLILTAVCVVLAGKWGLAALAMLPISVPIAWLDWRKQGWLITPQAVISRRGYLTRRTWMVARDKLQSVHVVQSPMMRWHGLGRVVVRVAGSDVHLPDIGVAEAHGVLEELSPEGSPGQAVPGQAVLDQAVLDQAVLDQGVTESPQSPGVPEPTPVEHHT